MGIVTSEPEPKAKVNCELSMDPHPDPDAMIEKELVWEINPVQLPDVDPVPEPQEQPRNAQPKPKPVAVAVQEKSKNEEVKKPQRPRFMRDDLCGSSFALVSNAGAGSNFKGTNRNSNNDQAKVDKSRSKSTGGINSPRYSNDNPDDTVAMIQKLQDLFDETGMPITQESGQRTFGPPVDWQGSPPPKGCEVFVGKLPRHIFEPHLIPLFGKIGPIYQLRMMIDFQGYNRGFCFIQYTEVAHAQQAIETLNDYEICPHRRIGVVKSVNNTRLFLGGIPVHLDEEEIFTAIDKICEGVVRVIICPPLPFSNNNNTSTSTTKSSPSSSGCGRQRTASHSQNQNEDQGQCQNQAASDNDPGAGDGSGVDASSDTDAGSVADAGSNTDAGSNANDDSKADAGSATDANKPERKNRGYAFVEFSSHKAACMARRKMFPKTVRLWGRDIHVDWAVEGTEIRNLHVTNVSPQTTCETLRNLFNSKGHNGVEAINHFNTFSFVHFFTRDQAIEAKNALDGMEIDGRRIQVNWAKPARKYVPSFHSQDESNITRNQHQRQFQYHNRTYVRTQSPRSYSYSNSSTVSPKTVKADVNVDVKVISCPGSGSGSGCGSASRPALGSSSDTNDNINTNVSRPTIADTKVQKQNNTKTWSSSSSPVTFTPNPFPYKMKNNGNNRPPQNDNKKPTSLSSSSSMSMSTSTPKLQDIPPKSGPLHGVQSQRVSKPSSSQVQNVKDKLLGNSPVKPSSSNSNSNVKNQFSQPQPQKRPPLLPLPLSVPHASHSVPVPMSMSMPMPIQAQYSVPIHLPQNATYEFPYPPHQQQQQQQFQHFHYPYPHPPQNLQQNQSQYQNQNQPQWSLNYHLPQQLQPQPQFQNQNPNFIHLNPGPPPAPAPPPVTGTGAAFDVNVGFGHHYGYPGSSSNSNPPPNLVPRVSSANNISSPWTLPMPTPMPTPTTMPMTGGSGVPNHNHNLNPIDPVQELLDLCHSQGWGAPSFLPVCYQNQGNGNVSFGCTAYLGLDSFGEKKFDTHSNYRTMEEAKVAAADGLCFHLKRELTCAEFALIEVKPKLTQGQSQGQGQRPHSGPSNTSFNEGRHSRANWIAEGEGHGQGQSQVQVGQVQNSPHLHLHQQQQQHRGQGHGHGQRHRPNYDQRTNANDQREPGHSRPNQNQGETEAGGQNHGFVLGQNQIRGQIRGRGRSETNYSRALRARGNFHRRNHAGW